MMLTHIFKYFKVPLDGQTFLKSALVNELKFGTMGEETVCSTHYRSQSGASDKVHKELDQDAPATNHHASHLEPTWLCGCFDDWPPSRVYLKRAASLSLLWLLLRIWHSAMVLFLAARVSVMYLLKKDSFFRLNWLDACFVGWFVLWWWTPSYGFIMNSYSGW